MSAYLLPFGHICDDFYLTFDLKFQLVLNWIFKVTFLHKTVFDRNWLFVVTLVIKIDDYDYNFNLILIQLSSVRILLGAKILTSHFGSFKLMQKQFLDSN